MCSINDNTDRHCLRLMFTKFLMFILIRYRVSRSLDVITDLKLKNLLNHFNGDFKFISRPATIF